MKGGISMALGNLSITDKTEINTILSTIGTGDISMGGVS